MDDRLAKLMFISKFRVSRKEQGKNVKLMLRGKGNAGNENVLMRECLNGEERKIMNWVIGEELKPVFLLFGLENS